LIPSDLTEFAPESVGPNEESPGSSLEEDWETQRLPERRDSPIPEAKPWNDGIEILEEPTVAPPPVPDDAWHNGNSKFFSKGRRVKMDKKATFAEEM